MKSKCNTFHWVQSVPVKSADCDSSFYFLDCAKCTLCYNRSKWEKRVNHFGFQTHILTALFRLILLRFWRHLSKSKIQVEWDTTGTTKNNSNEHVPSGQLKLWSIGWITFVIENLMRQYSWYSTSWNFFQCAFSVIKLDETMNI